MTVICLRNKQNQQGPRAPHQDPSNDDEKEEGDEAIKNQTKGDSERNRPDSIHQTAMKKQKKINLKHFQEQSDSQ